MNTKRVTVLDGGMGKHLERAGAPFRQPEWSALALIEMPDKVREGHAAFIDAGADVITTNAYAVVPFHIGAERYSVSGRELTTLAGRLAREAADAAERPVEVRGSLPPLFGSYQPELFEPDRAPELLEMLITAQSPFVDGWLCETMSSIVEADAALDAVERHVGAADVWVSFTVLEEVPEDGVVTLRSGESIEAAVRAVADRATGVLFNCSPPETIDVAVAAAGAVIASEGLDVELGAYANAFEPKPEEYAANSVVLGRRDELTPERYLEIATAWVADGASIVGGCCTIHTEHIDALTALR